MSTAAAAVRPAAPSANYRAARFIHAIHICSADGSRSRQPGQLIAVESDRAGAHQVVAST